MRLVDTAGIDITAKAIWLDRQAGMSNFKLARWLPKYLRWYRFAYGPQLDVATLRERVPSGA
jgi:hypothetical protein